jgi:hypothetical protein
MFLSSILLLAACNMPSSPASETVVWFDVPVSGLVVPINSTVNIEGHAVSSVGIERVELRLDDAVLTKLENLPAKGNLANFSTSWIPTAAGEYNLQAIAISKNGHVSQSDNTRVIVGEQATLTFTPTREISPTATVTPVITLTPSKTVVTPRKPTGTFTPRPPVEVEHPEENEESAAQSADTTGPPAPGGMSPSGAKLPCVGSVTLKWKAVSDPSGISGYKLEIQRSANGKSWQPHPNSPTAGATKNTFSIKVECGWHYRYRIMAIDGKGNRGPFSGWAQFSVILN